MHRWSCCIWSGRWSCRDQGFVLACGIVALRVPLNNIRRALQAITAALQLFHHTLFSRIGRSAFSMTPFLEIVLLSLDLNHVELSLKIQTYLVGSLVAKTEDKGEVSTAVYDPWSLWRYFIIYSIFIFDSLCYLWLDFSYLCSSNITLLLVLYLLLRTLH